MRSCFVSLTHTTPTLPFPPLPPLHPSHKHWQASSPPTVASAWVNRARADVSACVMGGGSCGGGACRVVMAAVVGAGVKGVLKSLREGVVCISKRAVLYVYTHLLYVYTLTHTLVVCVHTRLAGGVRLSAAGAAQLRIDVLQLQQVCCVFVMLSCISRAFDSRHVRRRVRSCRMRSAVQRVLHRTRGRWRWLWLMLLKVGARVMMAVTAWSRCHMHDVPCVLCGV